MLNRLNNYDKTSLSYNKKKNGVSHWTLMRHLLSYICSSILIQCYNPASQSKKIIESPSRCKASLSTMNGTILVRPSSLVLCVTLGLQTRPIKTLTFWSQEWDADVEWGQGLSQESHSQKHQRIEKIPNISYCIANSTCRKAS